MKVQSAKIGVEVVRSKGDYVVGRVGTIIDLDLIKNRAQVKWSLDPKSWVSFDSLELTSIPYKINPSYQKNDRYKTWVNPKYVKL